MASLRKAINGKCKDCIYDHLAPGNWRVQVSLCSCKSCPLWRVRPKTSSAIPQSVLSYYGVKMDEFETDYAEFKTSCKGHSESDQLIVTSVDFGCTRNKSAGES
jgi:hypothetical protein